MIEHTEYADLEALNWSSLKHMAVSPRMFRHAAEHPRKDTPAYLQGRALHCKTLEAELYEGRYIVRPEGMKFTTIAGKEWKAEAEADGLEILTTAQGYIVDACAAALTEHEGAMRVLGNPIKVEVANTWEMDGVPCKGRMDALWPDRVPDLKTCADITRLVLDAAKYLYYGQLAWYLDGAIAAGLVPKDATAHIVAVETGGCHDVRVLDVDDAISGDGTTVGGALAMGRALYRDLLSQYRACVATDTWPGKYPGTSSLELPPWVGVSEDGEW